MRHLTRGLRLLGERWTAGPRRWIKAGENPLDTAIRVALVGAGGYVVWRIVASSWLVLGVVVAVVCLLALRAATRDVLDSKKPATPTQKPQETPQETAPGATEDRLPEVPAGVFLALLYDALGTAKGIHLRTLAAALTARFGGAWQITDVRRLCEAAEVPVTPTVRAPGGKPTVGVYRVDVPPLPRPLPEGAAVGGESGGRPATTSGTTGPTTSGGTTTTPTVTEHGGGLRVVARDDPDNPHRTHVHVIDSRRRKRA